MAGVRAILPVEREVSKEAYSVASLSARRKLMGAWYVFCPVRVTVSPINPFWKWVDRMSFEVTVRMTLLVAERAGSLEGESVAVTEMEYVAPRST